MCEINENLTVVELENRLFALQNIENYDVVNLSKNNLDELDNIFPVWFMNVKTLNLSECNICQLIQGTFDHLVMLEHLNLSSNKLVSIPINFFKNCLKLTTIDLSQNCLTTFQSKMFAKMEYLIDLNLSINCLKEIIYAESFSLERLNLDTNEIFKYSYNKFERLKVLNLSNNCLEEIKVACFIYSPLLNEVNLNDNIIHNIDENAFKNLNLLQTILLNNNQLEKFVQIRLPNNSQITVLELDKNCLRIVDLKGFMHLKVLKLNENDELHEFRGWAFLPNLTNLEMKQTISKKNSLLPIENFIDLKTLDLRKSDFGVIPDNYFKKLKNLENLYLDESQADNLQTLKLIFHAKNSLKLISLSDCSITKIVPCFQSLKNLTSLNLSQNRITTLTREIFRPLIMLQQLRLDGNRIIEIKVKTFKDLKALQSIDLRLNEFRELHKDCFRNHIIFEEVVRIDPEVNIITNFWPQPWIID